MKLDKSKIILTIESQLPALQLDVLHEVDSTQNHLKKSESPLELHVCCAEQQTAGRGRFGRTWQSLPGEHLYLSMRIPLFASTDLSSLSLVVALSIIQIFSDYFPHLQIKWPNDILYLGKKLAGCLIERGSTHLIIGIGMNVNGAPTHPHFCSLEEIEGHPHDRNDLIAKLILAVYEAINQLKTHGFSVFLPMWQHFDFLEGKPITVKQQQNELHGIAKGVNHQGELILLDHQGQIHPLTAGEASLSQHGNFYANHYQKTTE